MPLPVREESPEGAHSENRSDENGNLSLKERLMQKEKERLAKQEKHERRNVRQARKIELPEDTFGKEREIKFTQKDAEEMYQLLNISSSDIGFSWPTEMLMNRIMAYITEGRNDEEIKNGILNIRNGEKIWEKLLPVLETAKSICNEE